jgi:hypothetical protein
VAVRVLESLDRANSFEPFREHGGRSDALLERREIRGTVLGPVAASADAEQANR